MRCSSAHGAVVDARGVARGHGAVGLDHALELGQRLERGVARMLVGGELRPARPSCWGSLTGHGLAFEEAGLAGGLPALCCERSANAILDSARDTLYSAATFSAVSGIESMPYLLLHQRVDEAPADGGVFDPYAARERAVGLGHHERRARSCSRRRRRSSARPRRCLDGARAVPTASSLEPHRRLIVAPGTSMRQAGEQRGHARDVAVVLAGAGWRSRRCTSSTSCQSTSGVALPSAR